MPWNWRLLVSSFSKGFSSGDSDFLRGMDDRDPSFGLGGHVIFKPENLGLKLAAVTDMADNSDGTQVRGEVFYTHRTADWMFKPYAGIVWQDDDYNDYYYGVRSSEVNTLIGRTAYSADSDINYRFGAVAVYQQKTSPWMYIAGLRFDFLGDEIADGWCLLLMMTPMTRADLVLLIHSASNLSYCFKKRPLMAAFFPYGL